MDHIGAGYVNADHRVDRNDQRIVDVQQPLLVGLQIGLRDDVAVEVEPTLVGILIRPVPLMSGDFDRHVRVRHPVHVIHQLEGRYRDNHQDQNRHHGPEHLDDGIVRGPRRHRVAFVTKANDDVEQQTQDEESDQKDDDQELVVKCRQPVFDRRGRRLHADFPAPRPVCPSERGEGGTADQHQREHKQCAGGDLPREQSRHLTLSLQPLTRREHPERRFREGFREGRTCPHSARPNLSPGLFEPERNTKLYHSSPGQQPAQTRLRPFASSRRTRKQSMRSLGSRNFRLSLRVGCDHIEADPQWSFK